jgi:hypothetical protein
MSNVLSRRKRINFELDAKNTHAKSVKNVGWVRKISKGQYLAG